ncbi:hypothetical protein CR513_07581, partial [Mucuna pruriens]
MENNQSRRTNKQQHPFVNGIIQTPLPARWKNLNIDSCHVWGTICDDSSHHLTLIALANLRQGYDKPLKVFMEQFASISIKIISIRKWPFIR